MKFQFSVAEETGLSLGLSETPKTGFVMTRPNYEYFTVSQNVVKYRMQVLNVGQNNIILSANSQNRILIHFIL